MEFIGMALLSVLLWAIICSFVAATALFVVHKHGLNEKYTLNRKAWMPHWCAPCFTFWFSLCITILLSLFLITFTEHRYSYILIYSCLMVPTMAIVIFKKFQNG